MALKSYNPVTPGQRQLVLVDRSGLHSGAPVKALTGLHSSEHLRVTASPSKPHGAFSTTLRA